MNRRHFLRALVALPLAPLATKLGLKSTWSNKPTIPGRVVLTLADIERSNYKFWKHAKTLGMSDNRIWDSLQRAAKIDAIVVPIGRLTGATRSSIAPRIPQEITTI